MDIDCLSFFQDRISNAYGEQIWAVTLVTAMNAFIFSQANPLLETFKYRTIVISASFTSILSRLFVWSRHIIFVHYDSLAKNVLNESEKTIPLYLDFLTKLSGVSFYTLIIFGMAILAINRLKIQNMLQNAQGRDKQIN